MFQYYALPFPGETLETYRRIARYKDGIFQRYYFVENQWVDDADLAGIFCGEYEADLITEKDAVIIIRRQRGEYA